MKYRFLLVLSLIAILSVSSNAWHTFYESDKIKLTAAEGTKLPIYVDGEKYDNPETSGADTYSRIRYYGGGKHLGLQEWDAMNYMRFSHDGNWGAHFHATPLITIKGGGVTRQGGMCYAEERYVKTGDNSKYGLADVTTVRYFYNNDWVAYGVGTGTSEFIDINRVEDGKRYFDFIHTFTFKAYKDCINMRPILQGISAMFACESAQDVDTWAWDSPDGKIHTWDITEEEWAKEGEVNIKKIPIGSFYEMHNNFHSYFQAGTTQFRIEVLDVTGVAAGKDIYLRLENRNKLWKDIENLYVDLQFGEDDYIDFKAGDTYTVKVRVTNDVQHYPWTEVYRYGFEDDSVHGQWSTANGVEFGEYAKEHFSWYENDRKIITDSQFIPKKDAEGVIAAKLTSGGAGNDAILEMPVTVDASNSEQMKLSAWIKTIDFDASDTLFVEHFDGSSWNVVEGLVKGYPVTYQNYNENGIMRHIYSHAKGSEHTLSNKSKFRFRLQSPTAGHTCYIDEIEVYVKRVADAAPVSSPSFDRRNVVGVLNKGNVLQITGLDKGVSTDVALYSMNGKVVYSQKTSSGKVTINTDRLSNSVYLLKVKSGLLNAAQKILIRH